MSPNDEDMTTLNDVRKFFSETLTQSSPPGRFLITKSRIAKDGVCPGELLVFSYEGEILYLACSETGRVRNRDSQSTQYPHYFCIDMRSLRAGCGTLSEFEKALADKQLIDRNIVRSRGWPIVDETGSRRDSLNAVLEGFAK